MFRPRILLAATAAACCLPAGATAADPAASLPTGWSHAQINVVGTRGRPHTFIFDRGRVQAVGASSLTLKERDGSTVTIQVSPNATVRVNGQPGQFSQIQPGFLAITLGVDGAPARRVQANSPPPRQVRPARTTTTPTVTTNGG